MKKFTSHLELLDRFVGEKGSIVREHFEAELRADILAAKIKEMCLKKKVTQEQLVELVGKDKRRFPE